MKLWENAVKYGKWQGVYSEIRVVAGKYGMYRRHMGSVREIRDVSGKERKRLGGMGGGRERSIKMY